jgi:hypothetical protein
MKGAPALRACPRGETLAPTFLIYGCDEGLQRLAVLIGQFSNIEAPLVYAAQQLQYFVARLFQYGLHDSSWIDGGITPSQGSLQHLKPFSKAARIHKLHSFYSLQSILWLV